MKKFFLASGIVLLMFAVVSIFPQDEIDSNQGEWVALFNGEDLSGWYTYQRQPEPTSEVAGIPRDEEGIYLEPIGLNNDPLHVFTVVEEDGEPAIRISGETFGILVTDEEYENYHFKLEFKWGDEKWPPREELKMDSGILYHSIGPEGAWGGVWMKSLECQVQETDCGDFIAVDTTFATVPAELIDGDYYYVEGADPVVFNAERAYCNHSEDFENPMGEWNTIEIYTVDGNSVHVVNGNVNMRTFNSQYQENGEIYPLTKGKIQLQSEGAEIYYRNIQIRSIDEIPDQVM